MQDTIQKIKEEAESLLNKSFHINGREMVLSSYGWKFSWNNRATSLGLCSFKNREIQLSLLLVEQNPEEVDEWIDTVRHEAAHALSVIAYRHSGHGWQWKACCKETGARPERIGKRLKHKTRWKLTCSSCNGVCYRDRVSKRVACRKCCTQHNGGKWSEEFILKKERNN
jgi:hypothetical protein